MSSAGLPSVTIAAALDQLCSEGVVLERRSHAIRSRAVPAGSGPDFVNAVAWVKTGLGPEALHVALLAVERRFGRRRERTWGPRTLDLDLLAYDDLVSPDFALAAAQGHVPPVGDVSLILPHPRLHFRPFVLDPLLEVAPTWRHPAFGKTPAKLLRDLNP